MDMCWCDKQLYSTEKQANKIFWESFQGGIEGNSFSEVGPILIKFCWDFPYELLDSTNNNIHEW